MDQYLNIVPHNESLNINSVLSYSEGGNGGSWLSLKMVQNVECIISIIVSVLVVFHSSDLRRQFLTLDHGLENRMYNVIIIIRCAYHIMRIICTGEK